MPRRASGSQTQSTQAKGRRRREEEEEEVEDSDEEMNGDGEEEGGEQPTQTQGGAQVDVRPHSCQIEAWTEEAEPAKEGSCFGENGPSGGVLPETAEEGGRSCSQ